MPALITWTGHNLVDQGVLSLQSGQASAAHPLTNLTQRGLASEFRSNPNGADPVRILIDCTALPFDQRDGTFAPVLDGAISAIVVQPDGRILVSGNFSTVNGVPRARIARLMPDGTLDESFNPAPNVGGLGVPIALQPDGKIIVCGTGAAFARLNADGSLDASFNVTPNSSVRAVAIQPDGKIVIGGNFTAVSGHGRNRIARINPDGSIDGEFGTGASGAVQALAIQPDGKIIIGGSFTRVDLQTRSRIARFNANGSLDASFTPSANAAVQALAIQSDGKIIIGGSFTTISSTARNRLARLNADGSLDASFNPNVDGIVNAVVIRPSGGILIGGGFSNVGDTQAMRIAHLHPDGALDDNFHPGANNNVDAIALQPDGHVLYGGVLTAPGRLIRARAAAPDMARIAAVLGLWEHAGGTITISARESIHAPWRVVATSDVSAQRRGSGFLPAHMVMTLDEGVSISSQFLVEFSGTDFTPVQFGRLWIGDAAVLPDGIGAGWSLGFRDSGALDPTDGQQWVESPGVRTRVLNIPLEEAFLTEIMWGFRDDAEEVERTMSLNAMQLEAGTTGEVIAVARTATARWVRHTAIYGHVEQPWAIGHKAGPYWGASLQVIEER